MNSRHYWLSLQFGVVAKALVCLCLLVPAFQQPASVPSTIQKLRMMEGAVESTKQKVVEMVSNSDGGAGDVGSDGQCRLWLAPSHTGTDNEPRYGLYAGIDYNQNDTIPNSELGIPLVDWEHEYNRNTPLNSNIVDLVESFLWTSEFAGTSWEGNTSAPILIPGNGVLTNYHSGISNVNHLQASVLLRKSLPYFPPKAGRSHPSRGAITPYYNLTFKATQHIPAGFELFADFGDVWDGNLTTLKEDYYQDKISRFDYQEADKIVDMLLDFFKTQFPQQDGGKNSTLMELEEEIMDFMLDRVLERVAGKHAKTIRSLIPANPRKLQKVKDSGGTFMYRYPDIKKSLSWLEENGMCLDNLRMGASTIPDAGRGAFAARPFKRGEKITVSPLLHIANQDLMNMYEVVDVTDDSSDGTLQVPLKNYDRTKPVGKQLIVSKHRETGRCLTLQMPHKF